MAEGKYIFALNIQFATINLQFRLVRIRCFV